MKIKHLSNDAIQIITENNHCEAFINNTTDRTRLKEILPKKDYNTLIKMWGEPNPNLEVKPQPLVKIEQVEPQLSDIEIVKLAVSELSAIVKDLTGNKRVETPNVDILNADVQILTKQRIEMEQKRKAFIEKTKKPMK